MPSEIQTPSTTPSIDRLELSATPVRGAAPSIPGAACMAPCGCAEVEVSATCPVPIVCFDSE